MVFCALTCEYIQITQLTLTCMGVTGVTGIIDIIDTISLSADKDYFIMCI